MNLRGTLIGTDGQQRRKTDDGRWMIDDGRWMTHFKSLLLYELLNCQNLSHYL